MPGGIKKIAAIQAAPVYLDAAATTDKALGFLREAASAGAELCAFPEVYISGYPSWLRAPFLSVDDDLPKVGHAAYPQGAIAADGPELAAISEEAAKLGVFVYIGFLERTRSGGSVYASLAAIHPDRAILSVHRKLKPTFHKRLIWSDGDGHGLQVHDWKDLRLGGLNCYENWLPLARQAMYAQGEQVHVAVWPGDLDVTEQISRFIAMEGRVDVVSVSGVLRAGDIPDKFPLRHLIVERGEIINNGGSMIVAPDGSVLAGPVIDEEIILYTEALGDRVMGERLRLDPLGEAPDIASLPGARGV